jgi:hypothetical protein
MSAVTGLLRKKTTMDGPELMFVDRGGKLIGARPQLICALRPVREN